ncbi:SAV_915 family protein [Micromonospora costi]|uniref:SseB family protein n=1 Tax=Micromonospora costi TaxID=1530042 RepID=A0A3B0AE03_9ACTN|nr:SAV_915 family protein [Micromonospora costi]RKN58589.1 hypothetical protein D7193_08690 [Micromonospora costi]
MTGRPDGRPTTWTKGTTMDDGPDTWLVPVRTVPGRDLVVVRTGRLPQGQRVGLAFSGPEKLAAAMGDDQPWIQLCEAALRGMLRPLGVERIQVDPLLVAPPVRPEPSRVPVVRRPALAGARDASGPPLRAGTGSPSRAR